MLASEMAGGRSGASPIYGSRAVSFGLPWLTLVLVAALIGVFALERRLNFGPATGTMAADTATLIALGGLNWTLVLGGEGYRVLSAPFLHGNLGHLTGNAVALVSGGALLERLAGPAWMFCIFTVGALAGSAASLAGMGGAAVGVGASGAIMAILAALFLFNFRLPPSRAKTRTQIGLLLTVVPALFPVRHPANGLHVDYAAHIGGATLGFVLGLLLLVIWKDDMPRPPVPAAPPRCWPPPRACPSPAPSTAWPPIMRGICRSPT